MQFTVHYDIPDSVAETLQQHWPIIARKNLEDITVIGYRTGILTSYQVQLMLGFSSRWETETFLHQHQCYLHYDEADLRQDSEILQALQSSQQLL